MNDFLWPLYLSMRVSLLATLLVALLGLPIGFFFSRRQFPSKQIIETLFIMPMILPPTVLGYILLILLSKNSLIGGFLYRTFGFTFTFNWLGAVVASSVVAFPLFYQNAVAAFLNVDRKLEFAARTLGKSPWIVFWDVTMPLAWPTLLAGTVLAFARALGEFGATLMLAGYIPGKTDTLTLSLFFAVANGEQQKAAIYTTIVFAFGFLIVYWLLTFSRRKILRHQWQNRRK
ncbi:MAG: molybdate ABC transporter permease subunit [Candidatus Carbobacillus altaicus]|uniref:Molybdenum transport system permease n=1 Tax=Candidatus Carbonibacillus altaicus TaxID=2163959 RepID=A0A2R6Y1C1_9BACL|nr:molybdate ABC transporter permease subunit [Candidatus Carbobacillus altaicus]PTQ56467.1 MAG: Molybdenum transport system permease protein ModB [Candidatus Carbobacillus altaicus]